MTIKTKLSLYVWVPNEMVYHHNNNNKHSVTIQVRIQVRSGEDSVYAVLPLHCQSRKIVFDRPSTQVKGPA